MLQERVFKEFRNRFDTPPAFAVRAPGRVNLIGEHTDYNDGFVLPMAIDRAVWIALRPRPDRCVKVFSIDFHSEAEFDLDDLKKTSSGWQEYLKATAWALGEAGYSLNGWEGVLLGDVPIGGGLSSSAAMEMAAARAFCALAGYDWDAPRMALLGQRAENEWIGMKCGIMDQMISAAGKANHAMLLDCRSLEISLVSLPPETSVVVMDTATRRELVDSAYNERRSQCQQAAQFFGVPALRDVSLAQFNQLQDKLDPLVRRRARHIITENERTLLAAQALRSGDAVHMGKLMIASHISLRDDYEVSRLELDRMVEIALGQEGCYGARMTGAGFGGCAVALIRSNAAESFVHHIHSAYQAATQLTPSLYVCNATNGAEIIKSPTR